MSLLIKNIFVFHLRFLLVFVSEEVNVSPIKVNDVEHVGRMFMKKDE